MKSQTDTSSREVIVMLGVHPDSKIRGGIASVVDVYRDSGLFSRWPILYIGTFSSGSVLTKSAVAGLALYRYLRLLCAGRVALVHAQTASRASFWRKSIFIVLALAARKSVIVHLHGGRFGYFYERECGAIRRWVIRNVLNRVDRVVVLSSQWKKVIESIAPAARVVRIANPVLVPENVGGASARDPNTLLFLSRLNERKGIFDLLRALSMVLGRFPDVRLRCAGDGDRAAVQAAARELGIEQHVELIGWVDGAAKERELSRATIYVLPSYIEGLPMGVLEAMAAAVPVVASRVGGIPDAIEDGVDGFLVEPGDVDALSDRLIQLLESVELRSEFGSAARNKARELFSTETVLSQLDELYRSLGVRPRAGQSPNGIRPGLVRTQG